MTEVRVSADACSYLHDLLTVARAENNREAVPDHLLIYSLQDAELLLWHGQCREDGIVVRDTTFAEPLFWVARFAALHGPPEKRTEMAEIAQGVGVLIGMGVVDLLGTVGIKEV